MANIIASGTTQAASADIVVAAGTPTTIHMSAAGIDGTIPQSARAKCKVQIKTAAGVYVTVAELTRDQPAVVIDGPGTYRVQRQACESAILVDQD